MKIVITIVKVLLGITALISAMAGGIYWSEVVHASAYKMWLVGKDPGGGMSYIKRGERIIRRSISDKEAERNCEIMGKAAKIVKKLKTPR